MVKRNRIYSHQYVHASLCILSKLGININNKEADELVIPFNNKVKK